MPRLRRQHAEQIERIGIVRVDLQDVPVGEFRGRELALAMRLASLAQKVPDEFVSRRTGQAVDSLSERNFARRVLRAHDRSPARCGVPCRASEHMAQSFPIK